MKIIKHIKTGNDGAKTRRLKKTHLQKFLNFHFFEKMFIFEIFCLIVTKRPRVEVEQIVDRSNSRPR